MCHSRDGYNTKQQCCPVAEPLTPMESFPPASHMMGNTPATSRITQVTQWCKAVMGEGYIPWHLSNATLLLWMSAVLGTWNLGAREKPLHIKSSSLFQGYFCHMLVFTAFLLLPKNCTHIIYSTTCMQPVQYLLYML